MKTALAILALLGLSLAASAAANNYVVFKATATIPVVRVDDQVGKFVTKTLTTNDVINLAMGRALGTPIKAGGETLALMTTFETPGAQPLSKLIVYDVSKVGSAGVLTVVATLSELQFLTTGGGGARNSGIGVGRGTFTPTTLGEPAKFGILSGSFSGVGNCSGPHTFNHPILTPAGAAAFGGPFKFQNTDSKGTLTVVDGLVVKGAMTLSGKQIGSFTE